MSNKRKILALTAMALALGEGQGMMFTGNSDEAFVYLPKDPIPPKGAKEYFFNIEGEFSTEQMRRDECVFKCFAINDKNAQRKFNKFKSNNTI